MMHRRRLVELATALAFIGAALGLGIAGGWLLGELLSRLVLP